VAETRATILTGATAAAAWLTERPAAYIAAFALILMWPALLNAGPFYFGDSAGYLRGGEVAVQFVVDRLTPVGGTPAGHEAAPPGEGVHGVRSIAYSVFAYLTRAPGDSWFLTSLLQAVAVATTLWVLFRIHKMHRHPAAMASLALLAAFLTPASWFSVFAMPDIWAGIAILAIALLTASPRETPVPIRMLFGGFIAFAVSAHLSHVPIIGLLVMLSGVVILARSSLPAWRTAARDFAWIALPALIGLVANVTSNAIGFKEVSVTGKRYPIVLASSIQHGPARWFLERNCATERFAVCELYPGKLPRSSGEFLWGPDGVRARATVDQIERIRAEEPEILRRAIAAYPFSSATSAASISLRQLVKIGLDDHHFEFRLARDPAGVVQQIETGEERLGLKYAVESVFLTTMFAALGALVWLVRDRRSLLRPGDRTLLLMAVGGCLINAVVCGTLSAAADRYQGRVIWVAVLCVAVIGWRAWSEREPRARRASPRKEFETHVVEN